MASFPVYPMSLQPFPVITGIVFTVPELSEDLAQMLRRIADRMNIDKRHVFIQDYKESFCNYLFYQPKELWQYDAALFCCDRNEIRAYMLRRLRPGLGGGKTTFVTVDEVASAHMKELRWSIRFSMRTRQKKRMRCSVSLYRASLTSESCPPYS